MPRFPAPRAGSVPKGDRPAVLICNGPSADGYAAPADWYAVTLNGGYTTHRKDNGAEVDCAYTVDSPFALQDSWSAFEGYHVQAEHVANLRRNDEFDVCAELMNRYHSSAFCAMDWLRRKGYKRLRVVGLDALWGQGHDGLCQREHIQGCLAFSTLFPEGFTVVKDGRELPVTDTMLAGIPISATVAALAPAVPGDPGGKPTPLPPAAAVPCQIPQTMVEFDVSPKCTRACPFCAPGIPAGRRKQRQPMRLLAHNAVCDDLVKLGYNQANRWLCYCGHGEPLLDHTLRDKLRYARKVLPACKLAVYTNGDRLTEEWCCFLEAMDVDALIIDVYDDATGMRIAPAIASSSMDPARVRVNDHVRGKFAYSSRCSTVRPADSAAWLAKPCEMADGKLFVTDDGDGYACSLLCCEDYGRKTLTKLSDVAELNKATEATRKLLRAGERAKAGGICAECDRDGGHPCGFDHVPPLVGSRFWSPERLPVEPPVGKRMVALAVNAQWAAHAEALCDAIDRLSIMPGPVCLIWNDTTPMPESLRRPGYEIIEYPAPLGWCGINRGFAEAFKRALKAEYRWVIKLDTDTAILRKGWDAVLCNECPVDAQMGTYMDVSITGQFPENGDLVEDGLFRGHIRRHCRWAHGLERRGLRKWDHMQGGCYVLGGNALKRIAKIVGLGAEDQENIAEAERVGEDVYIDTKCKVSKVPQRDTLRLRIWFRLDGTSLRLPHVRYQRDVLGVVAVHPVKKLDDLKTLLGEAV